MKPKPEDFNEDDDPEFFNEEDKVLVQKDIQIKDLTDKNKELEDKNRDLIKKTIELNEALKAASFKSAKDVYVSEEESNPQPTNTQPTQKFDIEYKNVTIRDFRLQLGEIALQDNGPFNIYLQKVEDH